MRKKIGFFCIIIGTVMVFCALSLFLYNSYEEKMVEQRTAILLEQIIDKISKNTGNLTDKKTQPEGTPIEFLDPDSLKMTEVEIDGYLYIGYLSIPKIEVNLPVMSEWDYTRLRISPCRYNGSVKGEDFVILGHNYQIHFGSLYELEEGDKVTFTDMDGNITNYRVTACDILSPYAVDEVLSGKSDLTLFTCTYDQENRVTIYCDRVKARSDPLS